MPEEEQWPVEEMEFKPVIPFMPYAGEDEGRDGGGGGTGVGTGREMVEVI